MALLRFDPAVTGAAAGGLLASGGFERRAVLGATAAQSGWQLPRDGATVDTLVAALVVARRAVRNFGAGKPAVKAAAGSAAGALGQAVSIYEAVAPAFQQKNFCSGCDEASACTHSRTARDTSRCAAPRPRCG